MLKGKSRWQLLVKAAERRIIHAAARALRPHATGKDTVQVALDVDPVSML